MRRIVHIMAILGIVLPIFSSCRAISNFLRNDEAVAQVGMEKLFRSDLDEVIPKGISPEDSASLAMQYIYIWASDQIYLDLAEKQLSKEDKDVTAELEEYRRSLLKYRYEQQYVNQRLDTSVTVDMIEEYYNANKEKFILSRPLVKARYLCIHTDSPNLELIRKYMGSDKVDDVVEADSIAFSSAMEFTTWNDGWIDAAILSGKLNMGYDDMLRSVKGGWVRQDDTLGVTDIAYITDIMKEGEYTPVDMVSSQIKDIIISARKNSMISSLEQDLLQDARENGQFVIF